ncbi:MAG: response regulator [Nitrospiraceae bacterium]|nr:response regulator [Nitrospiraceae bacterium]
MNVRINNVLIIDDDSSFLLSLSEGLREYEHIFKTFTAENGRIGLDLLHSINADLVVTDLKMPVVDGFEVLAHLAIHFPQIPVIVITAFGTVEIEKRIHRHVLRYMEKPLDYKELAREISKGLLSASKGRSKENTAHEARYSRH